VLCIRECLIQVVVPAVTSAPVCFLGVIPLPDKFFVVEVGSVYFFYKSLRVLKVTSPAKEICTPVLASMSYSVPTFSYRDYGVLRIPGIMLA
jgi:hypothetical protein